MMIQGTATGKGLNVKGKSAKRGKLSGFVPFVQISTRAHVPLVGTLPADARLCIYCSLLHLHLMRHGLGVAILLLSLELC